MRNKFLSIPIIFLTINVLIFTQVKVKPVAKWNGLPVKARIDSLLKYVWRYRSSDINKAFEYGREAIKLAENTDNFSIKAKAYNLVGILYRNISEFDSSFIYYSKAMEYAKAANDSEQIAYSYNNIGSYYGYNQMYFLALDNVLHARNIFIGIKNKRGIAFCDIQLALWFNLIKDFKDSRYYAEEALNIRKELNDEFGIAIAKSLLSNAYAGENNCKQAIPLAEEARKTFEKFNSKINLGFVLGNIASIKLYNKKYKEALKLRLRAIKLLEKTHDIIALIQNYNGLAETYLLLGKYKKAENTIRKAIRLSWSIKNRINLVDSFKLLMQVYGKTKNADKAIEYSLKYAQELDTVLQRQTETRIKEFHKILHSYKIIEKNIKLNESLKANKRILYLSGFTILITVILIIIIVIQNKKLRERSKILENTVATKDKLFGIIAHDLKNPFNTLFGYTEMILDDWDDFSREEIKEIIIHIKEVSQKLYDMVENLLQWAISQTGNLKSEPDYFRIDEVINKSIAYLQEHANEKNIKITTNYPDQSICYGDPKMVATIFRNLIANAIKFTKPDGEINISVKNLGGNLELKIRDNGIGMDVKELKELFSPKKKLGHGTKGESGTGLGLLLVKELVELNGGKIKEVKSKKGEGTEFTILLPTMPANIQAD